MPIKQERALQKIADKKGLKGKDRDRFVYGTMVNQGWRPNVDKSKTSKLSAMTPRAIRLHQINQKLEICFRSEDDDEEKNSHLGRLALGGVAVGVGGYGTYKGHQAIRARQGSMNDLRPPWKAPSTYADAVSNMVSQPLQRAANVTAQGAGAVASGLKSTGAKVAGAGARVAGAGKGAWEAILKKLGLRAATALSTRHEKLIELNARIEEVIEFVTPDERRKNQTPQNNMRRGIGIGLLGNSWQGAIAGGQDAAKFRDQGVVYRKRDVLGNSLGGTAVGGVTGVGLGLLSDSSTKIGRKLTGKFGSPALGIGSALAGIGTAYGVQRGLAAHTLKKRKAVYNS